MIKKRADNYMSIAIRDSNVGDFIIFPDGTKQQLAFKSIDVVGKIILIQINLINIKKDGTQGKINTWIKFRKYL